MRIEIEKLKKAYQGVMVLDIERMTIKTGKLQQSLDQMARVSPPY